MMYQIVETDNYGGDYPDEKFVLFPMTKEHANQVATAINNAAGEHASRYWKVEKLGYQLQPGFEP